mmetsp:Transcript_1079/g.2493  ORF Transcript_1079/g.2493 Transcript_1079/m.2493 type:complete len:123 (+) Transcript_1079:232-600(+)
MANSSLPPKGHSFGRMFDRRLASLFFQPKSDIFRSFFDTSSTASSWEYSSANRPPLKSSEDPLASSCVSGDLKDWPCFETGFVVPVLATNADDDEQSNNENKAINKIDSLRSQASVKKSHRD